MATESEHRPSPDALLAEVQRTNGQGRGRLKIFLGAAPGVGKTYTMLEAARARAIVGDDVVVGIVETHKRIETAEMMLGLEIVPRLVSEYQGRRMEEMDLDAVLARRPGLVLVDELAHSNVPGSRHAKRYQDVEELLAAGLDVYTTLNVQHIESMNDAVARITGVQVRETVPDRIVELANEVELVDISVEDLLQRLRDGKIYLPDQAQRALIHFFRPGNLNALRQLSLRLVAERVDSQMHTYMRAHAIPGPWPATERLMVSVGPSPYSARLVRATRRRAERRHAEWIALYVETPGHHRLAEADRDRVAATLRLAEELGGSAVTVPGEDVVAELIRYARANNVTEIVAGKPTRPWWIELVRGTIVGRLVRESGDIDVHVIRGDDDAEPATVDVHNTRPAPLYGQYAKATVAVLAATLAAAAIRPAVDVSSLALIFLLAVLLSAVRWGLRASIYASLLSLLAYDFFLVEPTLTFTITHPQDLLAVVSFLVVAVITSNLAGRIRDQARTARDREARTSALYDLSRAIAGAVDVGSATRAIVDQIAGSLSARTVLLLAEADGLQPAAAHPPELRLNDAELAAATWAWRNRQLAGRGTDRLPGGEWLYLPLRAGQEIVGVLAIAATDGDEMITPDRRRLLESMTDQAAVAVERAGLAQDIERARLAGERDRLQGILLSSISHDLRTPLAAILGSASSLLATGAAYDDATRTELLTTIQEEAERLNRFVGNLLDTTRLESGALTLNREWVEIGDILGTALGRVARQLAAHHVNVTIEPDLPLLRLDFLLMEQAIVNLLDNAGKYSPAGSTIALEAFRHNGMLAITVRDAGAGIPPADLELVFDKFYRVERGDRQIAGTGLGLSISRGIVQEHGGRIHATSPVPGTANGAIFTIELPIEEQPPKMEPDRVPE